jgi:hypothetical protein
MSNPFFESRVMLGEDEHLRMLKEGLAKSFDKSVEFVLKGETMSTISDGKASRDENIY